MWSSGKPEPKKGANMPSVALRLCNFGGYLGLILVNVLSSTGAFGPTNAEVSGKYITPLTPAGWAFAIWGIIFALQGLGVVYQLLNAGYREDGAKADVVLRIGWFWQLGWLAQDAWQFFFVRQTTAGMWLCACFLLTACASFQVALARLNGTVQELRSRGLASMPAACYVCFKLPTSINAAWLTVASALGLLIIPAAHGAKQAALVAPAAVLAVIVTAVGIWRLVWHRDAAYGLTLIWALAAVAANGSGHVPTAVKVVGIICLVILALATVHSLVRTKRERELAVPAQLDGGLLVSDSYGSVHPYSAAPYGTRLSYGSRADGGPGDRESPDVSAGYGHAAARQSFSFPALSSVHDSPKTPAPLGRLPSGELAAVARSHVADVEAVSYVPAPGGGSSGGGGGPAAVAAGKRVRFSDTEGGPGQ
ncbi:hypothetical protein HYH03_018288 [Edaphochlamys debaryana]|uniref:Uncharacterized protein n=1 Tax=Edaphochlamys debaryana TaxID=47281 RepID=A0A835XHD2_9CHLO|nr:hypothetical protein HYH03_018288 [Edaphochlamys debaryana]|eukprot:KAG2482798.1 hypothetical protein HYH03_018288 [Edaphochlamys debaryana]